MGLHRTLHGADHLMERREMDDGVDPADGLPTEPAVAHVPFNQLHVAAHGLEILPLPREEIIQHADPLSSLQQRLNHVRADKASSACHQIPRHRVPRARFTAPCSGLGHLRYNSLNATLWKPAAAMASWTAGLINASNSHSCR